MSRSVAATVSTDVAATASNADDAHHGHGNFAVDCRPFPVFAITSCPMQFVAVAFP